MSGGDACRVGVGFALPSWLRCTATQAALHEVEVELPRAAQAGRSPLADLAAAAVQRPGKRVRPALCLLSARLTGGDLGRARVAAAALELLHAGALQHDDIMDQATRRRGGPSTNAEWGTPLAAAAGTFLFARGSELMASLGETPNRLAARAALEVCLGQIQEAENAYDARLSPHRHLEIIARKTGTLFELPCALGAATDDAVASAHLRAYGRNLGIAFQISDDALDMTGRPEDVGKDTRSDLRRGVYGLPVLLTLNEEDERARDLEALLMRRELTDADITTALRLVKEGGGVVRALNVARLFAEQARAELREVEAADRQAAESLLDLARYIILRPR